MLSLKNASLWLLLPLLFSCTSNSGLRTEEEEVISDSVVQNNADSNVQQAQQIPQIISALVTEWNIAHNNKDLASLARLYADEVNLYGNVYSNTEALAQKKLVFQQSAQTYQQILGGAEITVHSPFVAKASFIKKVINGKSVKNIDAYLMLEKTGQNWKIVAESDVESDNKRIQAQSSQINASDINSCETAAEAIFRSSADVQKILKEPNARYKLEYTPGAPDNPNHRYWFWIYANAANSSSTETYARYQVDPITGQLYEFNAVEDKSIPVKSDVALQQYIKKYCGGRP